jgi:hypothetical protein
VKKFIISTLLLLITVTSFSQQTKPSTALTKQDYLLKSKHQKTTARILLYGGAVCVVAPLLIFSNIEEGGNATGGIFYGIIGAGLLAMPASIPFFLASSRNKKKGMSLSFKNETAPQLQNSRFVNQPVPSLTIKLNL